MTSFVNVRGAAPEGPPSPAAPCTLCKPEQDHYCVTGRRLKLLSERAERMFNQYGDAHSGWWHTARDLAEHLGL